MWKRKTIIFFCNYYSVRRDECTKFIFKHALHGIMIWLSRVKCINGLHVCMLGIFYAFLSSAGFVLLFRFNLFDKIFQKYHQIVKQFLSRPGPTSGLIRIKIVSEGYQQTTLAGRVFSSKAKCHTPTTYLSLL